MRELKRFSGESVVNRPMMGVFLGGLNLYTNAIWAGITEKARQHGFNTLGFLGQDLTHDPILSYTNNIVYRLASQPVLDGLIILSAALGSQVSAQGMFDFCQSFAPLPVVSVGQKIAGIPSLLVDNQKGLRNLIAHLITVHERRQIAFVKGPENNFEAQQRYQVYRETLNQYDLPINDGLVVPGGFEYEMGQAAIRELLNREVEFDAVVSVDDQSAFGVMSELQTHGLRVPGDVAVIGFDDNASSQFAMPPLTTVRQPMRQLGCAAVELLLACMMAEMPEDVMVGTQTVIRQSCGCLSPAAQRVQRLHPATVDVTALPEISGVLANIEQDLLKLLPEHPAISEVRLIEVARQLIEAVLDELTAAKTGAFLLAFDTIAHQTIERNQNLNWLNDILTILRSGLLAYPQKSGVDFGRTENLWHQARILLSEMMQQEQVQRLIKTGTHTRLLLEITENVISTFELDKLVQVIQATLKNLGIEACFLCINDAAGFDIGAEGLPEWSRLILAITHGEQNALEGDNVRFRTRQILPDDVWPLDRGYKFFLLPLRFQNQYLGYAIFEALDADSFIYDALQIQISNAIWGAHLIQQLNWAQNDLELRVQERTFELQKEIAERKRAENSLRENEERYRALFEQTNDAIFILSLDGSHLAVNQKAADLLGYTVDELLGMSAREVIIPSEYPESRQKLEMLLCGEPIPVYERNFRKKDGSTVPVDIGISLVRDSSGRPLHIQSVVRDITYRRRTERVFQALNLASLAMRQAQTPKHIFETVGSELKSLGFGCAIFRVSDDLSELHPEYYNYENNLVARASKLLKVDPDKFVVKVEAVEIFQKTIWHQETILVDDASEALAQLLPSKLTKSIPQLIRLLGGWRSINTPLVVDDRLMGMLSVQSNDLVTEDIPRIAAFAHQMAATWQKARLMQDLEMSLLEQLRVEESLRESEERYRTLFELSPEAIILLGLDGTILDANQAAADIGGGKREAIIGKSFLEMGFFDENEAGYYWDLFSQALSGGKRSPVEIKIWVQGHETRWVEVHPAFLKRKNDVVAVQLIVQDITDRKNAEQSAQHRMAELEAIYQISTRLSNASLQVAEIAEIAVQQLSNVMQLDQCSFSLYNPTKKTLTTIADHWGQGDLVMTGMGEIFQVEDYPLTAQVLRTLALAIIQADDPTTDPAELALMQQYGTATLVIIPLAVKGEPIGILKLETKTERHFTTTQLSLATTLANQIAVAIDNARLFEAAQQELLERIQAEMALQESEEQFRSIFENAVMGLYRSTPHGRIVMANPALVQMLGFSSAQELFERNLESSGFSPEHPRSEFKALIERDGRVMGLESAWRRRDGSLLYVQENALAIYDNLGKIIYYEGTVEDISSRKKAEEDRQALIEFQRIITTLSARFINLSVSEIDDEIIFALRVISEYTQADACSVWLFSDEHETASKKYGWPSNVQDQTNQDIPITQYPWLFSRLLKNQPVVVSSLSEIPAEAQDMHTMMGRFNMAAIYAIPLATEGYVIGSLSIYMRESDTNWVVEIDFLMKIIGDIIVNALERKRAEENIRQLNEELEQRVIQRTQQLEAANTELEAFAYSVSHDLRAPLRAIDGFSLALMEDYGQQLDGLATDYLQRVRAASQRMGQLIDDILKLSRLTRSEMHFTQVDLSNLVSETLAELREYEPQRSVESHIQAGLTAQGDEHLLRIMISNLLSNAWKFTSKKSHTSIEFGCAGNEKVPVFFIRDNGAGFDMAYADKLFGTFQRLHSTQDFEGTGIGLATVRRVVLRHGGRVWAEGRVNEGATFYFTIGETL